MAGPYGATPTGQRAFACWQSKGLARLLIKAIGQINEIQEIGLKDFVEKSFPFYVRKVPLFRLI